MPSGTSATHLMFDLRLSYSLSRLALALAVVVAVVVSPFSSAQAAADTIRPLSAVSSSDEHFGIAEAYTQPALARQAGARWERINFWWNQIQPTGAPGEWLPPGTITDDQISGELANGMTLVGLLGNPPAWATNRSGSVPKHLDLPWNDPRNAWGAFANRLAAQYAGKINAWVIWNEEDVPPGKPDSTWAGSPDDYYLLLKDAYQAIKAANPDATVVFGGTTYWTDALEGRTLFVQRVLDAAKTIDPTAPANGYYFDAISIHLYISPLDLYKVPMIYKNLLKNYGLDKPIWIGEMNVAPYDDPARPGGVGAPGPLVATQQEQANYIIRGIAMALAAGVQRFQVFKMSDGPMQDGVAWGLARNDGSVRPAYVAYQLAATYFSNATKITYTNKDNVDYVTFDCGDTRTTAVWNTAPTPTTATIPVQGTAIITVAKDGRTTPVDVPKTDKPASFTVPLAGATNGKIGGDPVLIVQSGITGFITISPIEIYFPSAGYQVEGAFLKYLRDHGGEKSLGLPTGEEHPDGNDRIVQTFEKDRLQYFPGLAGTDFAVQLGTGKRLPTTPQPKAPDAPPDSLYFPDTGHAVEHGFLDFFKANGGVAQFGFPRTDALNEGGTTVQYFQRAVMEYRDGKVSLRLIGATLSAGRPELAPVPGGKTTPDHVYFPDTGHAVSFAMLKFFKSHGDVALLGEPLTEEIPARSGSGAATEQWFQRARLEYYPANAGKPNEVQMGLLGDELLRAKGWL